MKDDRFAKFPTAWVEDERLDAPLLALLACLSVHADYNTGTAFPSQRRLAKLCGRTKGWVNGQLRILDNLGIIRIDRSQRQHVYTIVALAPQKVQQAEPIVQQADPNKNKQLQKKKNARAKKAVLTTDWQPNVEDIRVIKSQRPSLTDERIKDETYRFIDYFTIGKGAGTERPGWSASWRSWMRRAKTDEQVTSLRVQREARVTDTRRGRIADVVQDLQVNRS